MTPLLVLAALAGTKASTTVLIQCTGFERALNAPITNHLIVTGTSAKWNNRDFTVSPASDEFFLILKSADTTISITRTDGSFSVMDPNGSVISAWSRPQDAGCTKVEQKF